MWDLNRAERRALTASLFLVGLAGLGRIAGGPGPAEVALDALAPTASPVDEVARALAAEARAQTPLGPDERIDLGAADRDELRRLPGVGPDLAEAILRERARRPFTSAEDLERVPGIGPVTVRRLAPHVRAGPSAGPGARATGPSPPSPPCGAARVDVNRATREELEALPGIGPALAGRIIEARGARSAFRRPEELTAVRGIGPRSLERLLPLICAG